MDPMCGDRFRRTPGSWRSRSASGTYLGFSRWWPVACWNAAATERSRGSLQALPQNWMPVGRPCGPKPFGTDNAGWPASVPAEITGWPPSKLRYDSLNLAAIGYDTVLSDGAANASYLL